MHAAHAARAAAAGELPRRNTDKPACTGGNHLRFRCAAQPAAVQAVMIAFPMGGFDPVADPTIKRVAGLNANSVQGRPYDAFYPEDMIARIPATSPCRSRPAWLDAGRGVLALSIGRGSGAAA